MGVPAPADTSRLVSLDAYRGFIMLAMVSGGLGFPAVAHAYPDSPFWQFLGYQSDHVAWTGCAFWDLIQPSFMFMVGVALPYSHASRVAKGQTPLVIAGHTVYRSLLLIGLGVFLVSNWGKQTDFVFVNVLTQIGLGYGFVYLLVGRGLGKQLLVLTAILAGYWAFFYFWPLPGEGFSYYDAGTFGAPYPWNPQENGLFAHWNKNANAAAAFDDWFLNLFPQPLRVSQAFSLREIFLAPPPCGHLPALPFAEAEPVRVENAFFFNNGGYQTLNFIPSMGTMLLGLMAGELLRSNDLDPLQKFLRLCFAGVVCGLLGLVLSATICPSVKRIWTPSWVLISAGWTFAMLAVFYLVIDIGRYRSWALPMVVVGMNSIAVYCMSQLLKPWVRETLKRHLGQNIFDGVYFGTELFSPAFIPVAESAAFLAVVWLAAVWMYRQKIFIRI